MRRHVASISAYLVLVACIYPSSRCLSVAYDKCHGHADCNDGHSCTQDTCNPHSKHADSRGCVYEAKHDKCSDAFPCTDGKCAPGDETADHKSGCVVHYNHDACDDGFDCTKDVCIGHRDASAFGVQPHDVVKEAHDNYYGCGYKEKEHDYCECAFSVQRILYRPPAVTLTCHRNTVEFMPIQL